MKLILMAPDNIDHFISVGFKLLCNFASVFNAVRRILGILIVLLNGQNYRGWFHGVQSWLPWDQLWYLSPVIILL